LLAYAGGTGATPAVGAQTFVVSQAGDLIAAASIRSPYSIFGSGSNNVDVGHIQIKQTDDTISSGIVFNPTSALINGGIYHDDGTLGMVIRETGVNVAGFKSTAATISVPVTATGTAIDNYMILSKGAGSSAQIAFGRITAGQGFGFIGADSTNALQLFAGGTGSDTPTLAAGALFSVSQAGLLNVPKNNDAHTLGTASGTTNYYSALKMSGDYGRMLLAGGGAVSSTNGATFQLTGSSNTVLGANTGGSIQFEMGAGTAATFGVLSGSVPVFSIGKNGLVTVGPAGASGVDHIVHLKSSHRITTNSASTYLGLQFEPGSTTASYRGFVGISNGASGFVNGSAAGDLLLASKAHNILMSVNDGSSIQLKVNQAGNVEHSGYTALGNDPGSATGKNPYLRIKKVVRAQYTGSSDSTLTVAHGIANRAYIKSVACKMLTDSVLPFAIPGLVYDYSDADYRQILVSWDNSDIIFYKRSRDGSATSNFQNSTDLECYVFYEAS
jgi:hypothetical protein